MRNGIIPEGNEGGKGEKSHLLHPPQIPGEAEGTYIACQQLPRTSMDETDTEFQVTDVNKQPVPKPNQHKTDCNKMADPELHTQTTAYNTRNHQKQGIIMLHERDRKNITDTMKCNSHMGGMKLQDQDVGIAEVSRLWLQNPTAIS